LIADYVLALANAQIERADRLSIQLAQDASPAIEAIDRMMIEQLPRPELADIPRPLLIEFLKQLRTQL
jgi:hypothetical protein